MTFNGKGTTRERRSEGRSSRERSIPRKSNFFKLINFFMERKKRRKRLQKEIALAMSDFVLKIRKANSRKYHYYLCICGVRDLFNLCIFFHKYFHLMEKLCTLKKIKLLNSHSPWAFQANLGNSVRLNVKNQRNKHKGLKTMPGNKLH